MTPAVVSYRVTRPVRTTLLAPIDLAAAVTQGGEFIPGVDIRLYRAGGGGGYAGGGAGCQHGRCCGGAEGDGHGGH